MLAYQLVICYKYSYKYKYAIFYNIQENLTKKMPTAVAIRNVYSKQFKIYVQ